MLYGPAKRRQMARSILPSRARVQARERLRIIRRAHRRAVAQRLDADRRDHNGDVDDLFDLGDLTFWPNREIRDVVLERRYADTLNHFERWAVAATRDVPIEDRLTLLKAWLPSGLIGGHAVSHLRWIEEIHPRGEHESRSPRRVSQLPTERAWMCAALVHVFGRGLHGDLNRRVRDAGGERPLYSVHDINAFVAHVATCRRHECHERWCNHPVLDAVRSFIHDYEL